jgi:PAS domain-containing protein
MSALSSQRAHTAMLILMLLATWLSVYYSQRQASPSGARDDEEDRLAHERAMLRTLIDNLPDLIYVKDRQLKCQLASHAVARMRGAVQPEDLLGKTDFDYHTRELAADYFAGEQEVMRLGSFVTRQETTVDEQGQHLDLLTTEVPLRNAQPRRLCRHSRNPQARRRQAVRSYCRAYCPRMKGDEDKCRAAGTDHYLTNPIDRGRLEICLDSLLPDTGSPHHLNNRKSTMKLLRCGLKGHEIPAIVDHWGQPRDISRHIKEIAGEALLPESLDLLRTIDPLSLPLIEADPRIGPCVGRVGKIVGVDLNYSDHAAEANMPVPAEPPLFLKPSSAIVGPNDDVQIPLGSEKTDWEVELGIVIGRPAKYVPREPAMEHIAGYCIVNDVSERAYQLERGGQWDKGKACDTFAPLGPWLVTADEFPTHKICSSGWMSIATAFRKAARAPCCSAWRI